MKPLFPIVVAILVIATNAHSESTSPKELAKSKEPVSEAEESEPQARSERCTVCSGTSSIKTLNHASAAFQALPQVSEVHTQQFFEECNSEKGCAGVKLKDGKLVQKYGDLDAFKAAAAANSGDEFQFQAAANSVLEGKIPNGGPFWWMNENSPFKNAGANGGSSQKFSKFQSSSFSTSSNGGAGGVDIAANPFLNGEFAKINNGFSNAGANFAGQGFDAAAGSQGAGFGVGFGSGLASNGFNGGSQSSYGSSSQSSYSSGQNGFAGQGGLSQAGLGGAQGGLGGGSQSNFNAFSSSSKFGSGYTGSSPAPFSPAGSNVNLIQNSQKTSEYDFEQQQQTQQNIDEAFASTGNVQGFDTSGGDLQQTCAGQGYICVHKAQCNNGVVNSNGGNLLRANTQKQYCNTRTEVCCRLETSALAGSGIAQGSLGIDSATFSGSNQEASLFAQGGSRQNTFGSASNNAFNSLNRGTTSSGFGSNTNQFSGTAGSSQFGSSSFGVNKFAGSSVTPGFGTTLAPAVTPTRFGGNNFNNEVFKSTSQSNFVETDSFSSGSDNSGIFRPSSLKPGIPYLPPVDASTSASNLFPSSVVTTPRPFVTPRPVSSPRPFTPRVPTFLPPVSSTSAPGYLPPVEPLDGSESRPSYVEGGVILDTFLPPTPRPIVPVNNEIPAGCAAALKCTPIEFCTAEGVISNTTVVLTRDQDAYRVPLTDCKDIETGRIGKCCRDPYYTDPWPVNQLGKWVPDVFGGNDGKYIPDSRGSPNNQRPVVTVRPPTPPVTGSVFLNNFRTTQKPITPQGPNQITPGFPTSTIAPGTVIQKTQFNQGSYSQGGRGQFGQKGQGQFGQGSSVSQTTSTFGQTGQVGIGQTVTTGQGIYGQAGKGQIGVIGQGVQRNQGTGFAVTQGVGQGVRQGSFGVSQTSATAVSQGFGTGIRQGQGTAVTNGQGIGVIQGTGQGVSQSGGIGVNQGFGTGIRQGQGTAVTGGQGFGIEQGIGQGVSQGSGIGVTQGFGTGIRQGQGTAVTGTRGFGVQQGAGQTVTQSGGIGVSQGFGTGIRQGQGTAVIEGQGIGVQRGQGVGINQGAGIGVSQGTGFGVSQGAGTGIAQGTGFGVSQGSGIGVSQGTGFGVSTGQGTGVITGQGVGIRQGQGQLTSQGFGQGVRQGAGFGINQGGGVLAEGQDGFGVSQNSGFGIGFGQGQGILAGQGQALKQGQGEEITQESVHRVFLSRYGGSGQCGVPNPQKPYGNRQDLEVDFAEIPWQAMVLLQTNRSLLCGGVITRPDVVLTSASCVEGLLAKNVLIKGGEWKLGVDDEPLPFQIVQVKHILRHPFYKPGSLKYDAAVLVLSENLRLQKNIWPICLPSASDRVDAYYNGAGECIVTGWGKNILQAHLQGSIMHGMNVSLINPQECEAKIQDDYPHLLDRYDEDSCVCGQPTNPANNICKVDTGSALACTTDGKYTLRGIYSWESGCQVGNQLAAFYKFDIEWYEWSIGLIESVRFAQFTTTQITKTKVITQVKGGIKGGVISGTKGFGVKGQSGGAITSGVKGFGSQGFGIQGQSGNTQFDLDNPSGIKTQTGQFAFGKFAGSNAKISSGSAENGGVNFGTDLKGPLSKTFSATFTEKKFFQTEPKFVTYTTKPEIVTFTTKPEYFTFTTKPKIVTYTTKPEIVTYTTKPEIVTYTTKPEYFTFTTKPKIVTYTTKPQIISYETSGSATNPKYISPDVSFSEIVGAKHIHSPQCKCNGKK